MIELPDLQQIGLHHPKVKEYLQLKNNTRANPGKLVAIEGIWALSKAAAAHAPFELLFVCPELIFSPESTKLIQDNLANKTPCVTVSEKVMARMVDRDKPDGLAALVALPQMELDSIDLPNKACVVILDALEIPGNVGTIIRTADATGITAVILTNKRTRLTHPKVVHGSMGSIFTVPTVVAEVPEVLAWLRKHHFTIFTASTRGSKGYRTVDYTDRCALVMGSERFGIAKDWHAAEDVGVQIPMLGVSDSLNVGHATALLMYEALHSQQPELFT
ncbi:MAG TPA: RNA methyltransferase [Candidatus Saccharimonadales bacterium]|nr:RNA methyltransferase [Candidatus Saccharimonadales bacterium]